MVSFDLERFAQHRKPPISLSPGDQRGSEKVHDLRILGEAAEY